LHYPRFWEEGFLDVESLYFGDGIRDNFRWNQPEKSRSEWTRESVVYEQQAESRKKVRLRPAQNVRLAMLWVNGKLAVCWIQKQGGIRPLRIFAARKMTMKRASSQSGLSKIDSRQAQS
jgi:hypothetical protein